MDQSASARHCRMIVQPPDPFRTLQSDFPPNTWERQFALITLNFQWTKSSYELFKDGLFVRMFSKYIVTIFKDPSSAVLNLTLLPEFWTVRYELCENCLDILFDYGKLNKRARHKSFALNLITGYTLMSVATEYEEIFLLCGVAQCGNRTITAGCRLTWRACERSISLIYHLLLLPS